MINHWDVQPAERAELRGAQERKNDPRRWAWIVAGFLAVQISLIALAANGPFVDEGLYTVAGLRVLEGNGLSDGYVRWFNGSPFVWPVMAALGHRVGGLPGARLMATILCTIALIAFFKTAETLFGQPTATWGTLALAINGLFMALAHFAVYDVAALAGLGMSMWCVTRSSSRHGSMWAVAAAIAFAAAVIAKYGTVLMVVPLLALMLSVRGLRPGGRLLAVFISVAGIILAAYFFLFFGSLVPASSAAYLEQTFGRSRGHIAALQLVFALVPGALASVGAYLAWRRRQRGLAVTCLLALVAYPLFHLWSIEFCQRTEARRRWIPVWLSAGRRRAGTTAGGAGLEDAGRRPGGIGDLGWSSVLLAGPLVERQPPARPSPRAAYEAW